MVRNNGLIMMFSQKLIIIDVRSTVLSFYLTDAIKDLRHLV
jgi:hypothetical protein